MVDPWMYGSLKCSRKRSSKSAQVRRVAKAQMYNSEAYGKQPEAVAWQAMLGIGRITHCLRQYVVGVVAHIRTYICTNITE